MLEDGEIIRRCMGGQMGMMNLLIDRYKTDLYSLCVRLTRSGPDADDLFQDTWVKAMKSLESYNPEYRFKTWLFAICTNRYRDLYRWRKRWWRRVRRLGEGSGGQGPGGEGEPRPEDELAVMKAGEPTPEEGAISREAGSAVREALDTLDDPFRLPILLHYFQDLSAARKSRLRKMRKTHTKRIQNLPLLRSPQGAGLSPVQQAHRSGVEGVPVLREETGTGSAAAGGLESLRLTCGPHAVTLHAISIGGLGHVSIKPGIACTGTQPMPRKVAIGFLYLWAVI